MPYTVTLRRLFTQSRDQAKNVEFITRRVLSANPSWECLSTVAHEVITNPERYFVYRYTLTFDKTSGRKGTADAEWNDKIVAGLMRVSNAAKFRPNVWEIESEGTADEATVEALAGNTKGAFDINTGVARETVRDRCLEKINQLLTEKDAIKNCKFYSGIFEREPHIRLVLSSIKSFLESDGERRNHVLLFGLPACAKTQILNATAELLGNDAVVRLDGTSTTPAGIYSTYFDQFDNKPEPPFVILEEAEKTAEESLRVWLGVLDDRGELRKVNYREQRQRNLKVLCLATANDKREFDLLMGGTDDKPGALSSRFVHQVECPRPNEKVMRLILQRDIESKGGSVEWIEPVLELSKITHTDDPRKVLGFLDGGARLMNGEYKADVMQVYTNGVETLEFAK